MKETQAAAPATPAAAAPGTSATPTTSAPSGEPQATPETKAPESAPLPETAEPKQEDGNVLDGLHKRLKDTQKGFHENAAKVKEYETKLAEMEQKLGDAEKARKEVEIQRDNPDAYAEIQALDKEMEEFAKRFGKYEDGDILIAREKRRYEKERNGLINDIGKQALERTAAADLMIKTAHPDSFQVINSPEFAEWEMSREGKRESRLFQLSGDPKDAIEMLNSFKESQSWKDIQAKKAAFDHQAKQNMDALRTPTSLPATPGSNNNNKLKTFDEKVKSFYPNSNM